MRIRPMLAAFSATTMVVQLACAPGPATSSSGATTGTAPAVPAASMSDPDVRPSGATGLPAGYVGRADNPQANLADARYVVSGNGWEITTGPAHVLYSPADTASGSYTLSTTIQQLERPRHPEAFGVFIGGRGLDGPDQTYTYFLVRGAGEVFAQVRTGTTLRNLIPWSRNAAIPVADTAGRASYRFDVRVGSDSVRLVVNGSQVGAVAAAGLPVNGIAGLRINHNLHAHATPPRITRP